MTWLLWTVGLLFAGQFVLGPVVVYFSQRLPERYRFDLLDAEEFLAGRGPFFNCFHEELLMLGFRHAGSAVLQDSVSSMHFSIYCDPGRGQTCTLSTGEAVNQAPTTQAEFTRINEDGTLVNVNNNGIINVYPRWPNVLTVRLPGVESLHELLGIAEEIGSRCESAAVPIPAEDAFAVIEQYINDEMDRLIEIGWVSPRLQDGKRRLTPRGAALMTWKMCWPVKWIIDRSDRARSQRILRQA